MADREEILRALDRFEAMVASRDKAILSEFADAPDSRLIGSELSEVAAGPDEIGRLVQRFFDMPVQIGWEWRTRDVSSVGDVAWLYAEGHVVISDGASEQRSPYRLTGVLERTAGTWRWRLFHGSEPIPDR
jgi:ketosteroid isomerase-like protein